jgi:beta-carotene 3-hydroxylase
MLATWLTIFFTTFLAMELVAWFLHKYVMHGFLWSVHEDHHDPHHKGTFQKNDSFALFFFFPSFFSLLFGAIYGQPLLQAFGYGIMAYGAAYFIVHEVIIHRRMKFLKSNRSMVKRALVILGC